MSSINNVDLRLSPIQTQENMISADSWIITDTQSEKGKVGIPGQKRIGKGGGTQVLKRNRIPENHGKASQCAQH